MVELAKQILDESGCTLVVVKDGKAMKFYQRGVADLCDLYCNDKEQLSGAYIADKIIGKAAASLMIEGKVKEVFARVITHDALAMFDVAGIPATYTSIVDIVENRTKSGRCPLDTLCSPLSDTKEMVVAIRAFLKK